MLGFSLNEVESCWESWLTGEGQSFKAFLPAAQWKPMYGRSMEINVVIQLCYDRDVDQGNGVDWSEIEAAGVDHIYIGHIWNFQGPGVYFRRWRLGR